MVTFSSPIDAFFVALFAEYLKSITIGGDFLQAAV
jgi:hypothetical protein